VLKFEKKSGAIKLNYSEAGFNRNVALIGTGIDCWSGVWTEEGKGSVKRDEKGRNKNYD
jgi:hypothetical protein